MRKKVIGVLLFLVSFQTFSQDFETPKDYKLEKDEDFVLYEQNVIDGVNWLLKTPLTQDQVKRKRVTTFLMKWLTGSPNVSIELTQEIVTFIGCSDCLMAFMGGWAKYSIENKDYTNKVKGNMAGIESVIEFYKKNMGALGKIKAIQKYMKLQEKNQLEKNIESKLSNK